MPNTYHIYTEVSDYPDYPKPMCLVASADNVVIIIRKEYNYFIISYLYTILKLLYFHFYFNKYCRNYSMLRYIHKFTFYGYMSISLWRSSKSLDILPSLLLLKALLVYHLILATSNKTIETIYFFSNTLFIYI